MVNLRIIAAVICVWYCTGLVAQNSIVVDRRANAFALVSSHQKAEICTDSKDDWLVQKVANLLRGDIAAVTGNELSVVHSLTPRQGHNVVVIGTLDNSSIIRELVKMKKLNVAAIRGRWDAFSIQSFKLENGVRGIAVIGAAKRGAAYATFTISREIGVSPWYWWADVPAKKHKELYIRNDVDIVDSAKVKYRGIFINDEAPAFSRWNREKFGGANHLVYEKMFELLLRLKANYLWPAMWGNAFNDDDTLNPILADKWGIVMGTSHHEPMLRAQQEWKRYGKGPWDYTTNSAELQKFWRQGIVNMGHHESVVTVGMRGDGDKPMTQGTAIGLLKRIIADQRKIIEDVTNKPASATPQVWALYKEVQDYYDKGMRVPDDITLLLCDDNWGNIRRLPKLNAPYRSGGYGIYYHFDYVGGPRNYKWINTNNIARVWEQMHLAYEHGVKKIWVVNVGDLKPMEFPISFWCDYAWNPDRIGPDNLDDYYQQWAADQFGRRLAPEIGGILRRYNQYAARVKPELLNAHTYSLDHFDEWRRVVSQWDDLLRDADSVANHLSSPYKAAYFQLVLHPVLALGNLFHLYYYVAVNNALYNGKRQGLNLYADSAKAAYLKDSLISLRYNRVNDGKWNHMMDQVHIGYRSWQEPRRQSMPKVFYEDTAIHDHYVGGVNQSDAESRVGKGMEDTVADVPVGVKGNVFFEKNGYVSIQAADYSRQFSSDSIGWKIIPNIGKDGDGVSSFPVTTNSSALTVTTKTPHLDYDFYTYRGGSSTIDLYFSPTLNFAGSAKGLMFAMSVDNNAPQLISLNAGDNNGRNWNRWVSNNIIVKSADVSIEGSGKHTLHYWLISPAVVLQKVVVDMGGSKKSYLGAPETRNN